MKTFTSEQRITIFIVLTTSFAATFMGSALNLSIPVMGSDFHVSASSIGWVVTAYMLAVSAFSAPFGRLADITRKKSVFIPGLLVFAISALASALAWNFTTMIVIRIVSGLGGAMIFSTATAILISAFPGSDRGKVLGYSVAATYAGLSFGPVAGGFLNHYFGWRSIFIFTFALSLAVFIIALLKLPKGEKGEYQRSYDIPGNVMYVAMIAAIMCGFSTVASSRAAIALIIGGAVLSVCFVKHEERTENPVVRIELFTGNIAYSFSNLAAFLNYGATYAIGYLLSICLQVVRGYSSQTAGFILIAQPVIMAALSPRAGKLSDRVSPFLLASAGMGLCATGIVFLLFISEDYPLWLLITALVITGVGFALFSSPNTNAVMSCVASKDYGVASSILATMRSLGHTSSMAIVTFMAGIHLGKVPLALAETSVLIETIRYVFILLVIICLVGVFISAKRKIEKNPE